MSLSLLVRETEKANRLKKQSQDRHEKDTDENFLDPSSSLCFLCTLPPPLPLHCSHFSSCSHCISSCSCHCSCSVNSAFPILQVAEVQIQSTRHHAVSSSSPHVKADPSCDHATATYDDDRFSNTASPSRSWRSCRFNHNNHSRSTTMLLVPLPPFLSQPFRPVGCLLFSCHDVPSPFCTMILFIDCFVSQ